jgi:hypothetical protein
MLELELRLHDNLRCGIFRVFACREYPPAKPQHHGTDLAVNLSPGVAVARPGLLHESV